MVDFQTLGEGVEDEAPVGDLVHFHATRQLRVGRVRQLVELFDSHFFLLSALKWPETASCDQSMNHLSRPGSKTHLVRDGVVKEREWRVLPVHERNDELLFGQPRYVHR